MNKINLTTNVYMIYDSLLKIPPRLIRQVFIPLGGGGGILYDNTSKECPNKTKVIEVFANNIT